MSDKLGFVSIVSVRDKNYCHDCFNKLSEKDRGGRMAMPLGWVADLSPNATCSKCGCKGYHELDEEEELVSVNITLALGRSNHTWEEKVVSLNLTESQVDEDEYPLQELAFEWLMRNEPEYLNKVAPSFWTLIHVEFVREGK